MNPKIERPSRRSSGRLVRIVGVLAVVSVLASGGMAPAHAEPVLPPETSAPPPPADAAIRESLEYLMTEYGVSKAEAKRRLDLQDRAAEIAATVRATLGNELLDVSLDQVGGGKLTFLTSRPEVAKSVAGAVADPGEIRIVRSKFTYAQLVTAEKEARTLFAADPKAMIGIDKERERITVYLPADAVRAAQLRALVDKRAASRKAVQVPIFLDTSPDEIGGEPKACELLACDTPMRGGVRLHVRRDNGSWGSCTTGFNLRGNNGWAYVLTAGHCVVSPGPKRQYMYHNGLPAVVEMTTGNFADPNAPADTRFYNTSIQHDFAILPYQHVGGHSWSGYWIDGRPNHNRVKSYCVAPSLSTCYGGSTEYSIIGMYTRDEMQVGWVVCATGTGTAGVYSEAAGRSAGTRCGRILSKTMTDYNTDLPWGRAIKVDICGRHGDSGGPLFGQQSGKAYGILSGGPTRSGACDHSSDQEYSVYSPLSEILPKAQSQTGIQMSLITSAAG
ncbi:S1 family peptidase [Phytohabitans sp. LJ34]|uniref:S1 family peptidase n=1 Tax=Phytohabitans sp. LJ34 TaxID=3452217 RepID=UPI003F8C8FA5